MQVTGLQPEGAQIWHTSDGGSAWEMQFVYNPSFYYRPLRVFFADPRHGWIVGERGIVLQTSDGGVTSVPDQNPEIPQQTSLWQNFPNPFNSITTIRFDVPVAGFVELTVVNSIGQTVMKRPMEFVQPGSYKIRWDAADNFGKTLPSGMYVYRLSFIALNGLQTHLSRKMIFLK